MGRQRKQTRIRELASENARLKAKLYAAHDQLHNGDLNALHETLHCPSCEEAAEALSGPLAGQNVSIDAAARLSTLIRDFNRLCGQHQINACVVALIPSATRAGYVSVQLGGSVDVINWVRREMGKAPTVGVGDHHA